MPRRTTQRVTRSIPSPNGRPTLDQRNMYGWLNGQSGPAESSSLPLAALIAKYPKDTYDQVIRALGIVVPYAPINKSAHENKTYQKLQYLISSLRDYNEVYTRRPEDELTINNSTDQELLAELPYVPFYENRQQLQLAVELYLTEGVGFFRSPVKGSDFLFVDKQGGVTNYTFSDFKENVLQPEGVFYTSAGKKRLTPLETEVLVTVFDVGDSHSGTVIKRIINSPLPTSVGPYKLVPWESIRPALSEMLLPELSDIALDFLAPEQIITKKVIDFYQLSPTIAIAFEPKWIHRIDLQTGVILTTIPNPFGTHELRCLNTPIGLAIEGEIGRRYECRVYSDQLQFIKTLYRGERKRETFLSPFDLDEFLLRSNGSVMPYPKFIEALEETKFEPNARQNIMNFLAAHSDAFIDVTHLSDSGEGLGVSPKGDKIVVELGVYFANVHRVELVADRTGYGIEAIIKFLMIFTFGDTPIYAEPPIPREQLSLNVDNDDYSSYIFAIDNRPKIEARDYNELASLKYAHLINPPPTRLSQRELAKQALDYYTEYYTLQRLGQKFKLAVGIGGQLFVAVAETNQDVVVFDVYSGVITTFNVSFNIEKLMLIRSTTTYPTYVALMSRYAFNLNIYNLNTGEEVLRLPLMETVPLSETVVAQYNTSSISIIDVETKKSIVKQLDASDTISKLYPMEGGFATVSLEGQLKLYSL